jgi:hypothetical protein
MATGVVSVLAGGRHPPDAAVVCRSPRIPSAARSVQSVGSCAVWVAVHRYRRTLWECFCVGWTVSSLGHLSLTEIHLIRKTPSSTHIKNAAIFCMSDAVCSVCVPFLAPVSWQEYEPFGNRSQRMSLGRLVQIKSAYSDEIVHRFR